MEDLGKAARLIVGILRKSSRPLSTYEIAKFANISWATANIHCYKLLVSGMLESREEEAKIGVKRVVWNIKK